MPGKPDIKTVAIIPAAGAGVRMGADKAKQFLDIQDRPVLALTLAKFEESPVIDSVFLVVPAKDIDYCRKEIVDRFHLGKVTKIVAGGKRRQDSVRHGVEATNGEFQRILIHDGVRPFIDLEVIETVVTASDKSRAVILGLPARETVKEVDADGLVVKTHDRSSVWLIQTPQVFRYDDIIAAHKKAVSENWEDITDDALLMEKMGIPVKVIPGKEDNIKITTPGDLEFARSVLSGKK